MLIVGLLVSFVFSLLLVPFIHRVGDKLNVVAQQNERTIHQTRMVQIGGLAIYISFMLTAAIFLRADRQVNAILIGGFIVMLSGLLDDLMDLKPIYKLLFQIVAVLVVVFYGEVRLSQIILPFGISFGFGWFSTLVTILWILGITNAINLMDGLDGLATGLSIIMLSSIGLLSLQDGRADIALFSFILVGAALGFLFYNFYPAKIFLGDTGALFLGFMIAVISLLGFGFKTSTFLSLGPPILILSIPIIDTLVAMIRRRLSGKKISEADRGHLHHVLMYKLNVSHRNTVIILYLITALFSVGAQLFTFNKRIGVIFIGGLILMVELMIEYTGMLNEHYYPILSIFGFRRETHGQKNTNRKKSE